jgi:class 3 adenylate cyclase/tetratricopeptide (TPR) repeat protein
VNEHSPLALLSPYVPAALLRKLSLEGVDVLPPVETVRGATLLLDIAGFTPMVVSLSGGGARGIDALQNLLKNYFTEMLAVVTEFGGDVYQFAGDSILACFEPWPGESDSDAVLRTATCGRKIQEQLSRFARVELLGHTFTVSSRIGIGFGEAHRIVLGHTGQWMHPGLIGQPIQQAILAEKKAQGGEVILSPEAQALLPSGARVEPRDGFFKVEALPALGPAQPPPWAPRDEDIVLLVERCSRLLHPLLFTRTLNTHQDFRGDFRDITCLFARVVTRATHADAAAFVEELNPFYELVQHESGLHGGVLLMTDFTDKGNILYVLFGAPTAQENKEVLACRLACKLLREREAFANIEMLQVGIATSHAYCGEMGSPSRKGYWALGEVVNMAARLMTHGGGDETRIQVDSNTERKLQQGFVTQFIEHARLKGVDRSIPVYRVHSEARQMRSLLLKPQGQIVGRREELEVLRSAVERSMSGVGQVCVVSGEAGIGKSRLASRLVEEAEARGARTLYGICYSYEMFTPFYPWKEVLRQVFQLHEADAAEEAVERIRLVVEELEGVGPEWVPVVAGILGLRVEEGELTRELDARLKNQKLFHLVHQLVIRLTRDKPLLLFFEDLHWADNISIDLLEYVAPRLATLPVTLLVSMRPGDQLKNLRALQDLHHLELNHLNDEDTRALLRLHLRLDPPHLGLEEMLLSRVHGNPFFIESLVEGLREQGYLAAQADGTVVLQKSLQGLKIPDSIQDVVLGRIDLLPETEKMVVKVASVIGRIFTLDAVHALLPGGISMDVVRQALNALTRLGLILLETEEPFTCIFKHIVIRDVAYNTLLVSGREDLHRRLARYLEARASDNPVKSSGILAYHFLAGNDEVKGLEYALMAARSAKAQYANEDAIHHYNRALEVLSTTEALGAEQIFVRTQQVMHELAQALLQSGNYTGAIHMFNQCLADEMAEAKRAEIHLGLGRAFQEKGESRRAIQELEQALQLMGRVPPRTLPGLVVRTALNFGKHLAYRAFPWLTRLRPLPAERLPNYLKQLSTLISLIRIYYFEDIKKLTWATMVAINMASRTRSDYGLSLSSGFYGAMLFGAGFLKGSGQYLERALEHGRRSRDAVAEGLSLSRLSYLANFHNDLPRAIDLAQQSVSILRQVGEVWEVQTSLMVVATSQFLSSRFEAAEQLYLQMGATARELNALMHEGWSHAWAPMCRYLLGRGDVAELCAEMEQGLRLSTEVHDLANQCASLNHLLNVAVREHQVEEAALLAVRAYETIWSYQVLVPFLQVGLVDAAEGALFALEEGAVSVPRAKLLRIVRLCCFKARALGRIYPYLRGPALRVTARALRLRKGMTVAEPVFQQALDILEKTPNRWETGVAYFDAAVALPHRREEYLERAREIFKSIQANAELRRICRLEESGAAMRRLPAITLPKPRSAVG